jgi:hypothetical protein
MARRQYERTENRIDDIVGTLDQVRRKSPVPLPVRTKPILCFVQAAVQHTHLTVVERMGCWDVGMDPVANASRTEEGRRSPHRMDRRTHVVQEPRKGQLLGPCSATYDVGSFDDEHAPTRPRHLCGSGETIGACAYDNGVVSGHRIILARLLPWAATLR